MIFASTMQVDHPMGMRRRRWFDGISTRETHLVSKMSLSPFSSQVAVSCCGI
jgi:hypothetical protein